MGCPMDQDNDSNEDSDIEDKPESDMNVDDS